MTEDADLLERFVPFVKGLAGREELRKKDILVPPFLLGEEGNVAVYYAPFHHVNEDTRLVLVGITPGWNQAEIAFRRTRHHLLQDNLPAEASRKVAQEASFAGSMRGNIIQMLNGLDVPRRLG